MRLRGLLSTSVTACVFGLGVVLHETLTFGQIVGGMLVIVGGIIVALGEPAVEKPAGELR